MPNMFAALLNLIVAITLIVIACLQTSFILSFILAFIGSWLFLNAFVLRKIS